MIRLSTKNDIPQIIYLWNEAFGDSEKEIRFFLDNRFVENNTLVYEINGDIASMLFLLEGDMCIDGKCYPSYYLYAASTLKKYRGRGLMAELLSFAKEIANKRNKFFICLKPGEKSLFDFYEKHGYKTVFKIRKANYAVSNFTKEIIQSRNKIISDREELRNIAFGGHSFFKWDKQAIDFAFEHIKYFNGVASEHREGYLLYSADYKSLVVKETTFTDRNELFESIRSDDVIGADSITVFYPPWVKNEGEIIDYAMLTAVNDTADKTIKNINNAYLGLTLD